MKFKRKNATILLYSEKVRQRFAAEKEIQKKKEVEIKINEMKEKELKRLQTKFKEYFLKKVKKKIKIADFIIALLILLNISFVIYDNFLEESNEVKKSEYVKYGITGIIILINILLYWRYVLTLKVLRLTNRACFNDGLITSGLWKSYLIEFIILSIFNPPKLNYVITGSMLFGKYGYSSSSIILIIVLLKLYYMVRIFQHSSKWTRSNVAVIGKEHQVSVKFAFIFKAQFTESPYITITVLLIFTLTLFSIITRVFELGYDDNLNSNVKNITNERYVNYIDDFWLILITMLTVGYGDITPNTHFGRFIAAIAAVIGMVLISILIVTLSNFIEMYRFERMAYDIIKKKDIKKKTKKLAANLIRSIFDIFRLVHKARQKRKIVKYFSIIKDKGLL